MLRPKVSNKKMSMNTIVRGRFWNIGILNFETQTVHARIENNLNQQNKDIVSLEECLCKAEEVLVNA